jgi:hypothetical protein
MGGCRGYIRKKRKETSGLNKKNAPIMMFTKRNGVMLVVTN